MNKKALIIAIVAITGIAGAIWFFSGSKNKLYAYVPKESVAVGKVSIAGLFKKLDFEKLKKQDVVANALDKIKDDAPKFVNEIMESPEKSGIDFRVDPVVFFSADDDDPNDIKGGVLMAVDNRDKIKKLIENIGENGGGEYTFREDKDGGIEKAYPTEESDRDYAFAWNKDILVITFKEGYRNETNVSSYAEKILTLEKDDNIYAGSKSFKQFEKNSGDVDFYVNMNPLMKIIKKNQASSQMGGSEVTILQTLKNMDGISAHLNFGDASVELNNYTYYANPDEAKKMLKDPLDKKYADFITSNGKSIGAFGANLNAEELIKVMSSVAGSDKMNEVVIPDPEFTIKDLLKVFSGEFVVSVSDFKEKEVTEMEFDYETFESYPVQRRRMLPVINMQIGITRSSDVKKILEFMAGRNLDMKSDGDVYSMNTKLGDMYIVTQKDRVIISTDPKAANIKNGSAWEKPSNENITKALSENPMSLYVSLNPDDYPMEELGGNLSKKAGSFMAMMQDLTMTSDNDKNAVRLNLKQGEGNSLYRLVNGILEMGDFSDLLSDEPEAVETPYQEEYPIAADTTAAEPAVDPDYNRAAH